MTSCTELEDEEDREEERYENSPRGDDKTLNYFRAFTSMYRLEANFSPT